MNYTLIQQNRAGLQLKTTAILVAIASVLPLLVHLIPPYQGTPMGAILLPMFYVPLIALLFYRTHVGVIVAVLAPIINYLITGLPHWQFIALLGFELLVFTLIAHRLLRSVVFAWVAAPLAFLLAKAISMGLLTFVPLLESTEPLLYFRNALSYAVPGILLLWVINVVGLRYPQR